MPTAFSFARRFVHKHVFVATNHVLQHTRNNSPKPPIRQDKINLLYSINMHLANIIPTRLLLFYLVHLQLKKLKFHLSGNVKNTQFFHT